MRMLRLHIYFKEKVILQQQQKNERSRDRKLLSQCASINLRERKKNKNVWTGVFVQHLYLNVCLNTQMQPNRNQTDSAATQNEI